MDKTLSLIHWRDLLSSGNGEDTDAPFLSITRIQRNAPLLSSGGDGSTGVVASANPHPLIEEVTDPIIVFDSSLAVRYSNKAAVQVYGFSGEVTGKLVDELLPVYLHKDPFDTSSNGEEKHKRNVSVYVKDALDHFLLLDVSIFIDTDEENKMKGGVLLLKPSGTRNSCEITDVQWHYFFETYPKPIAVLIDAALAYVNTACASLYGASHKEQMIGRSFLEFALVPYHDVLRKRLETTASGERMIPAEFRIKRLDGHVRYVRAYSVPIEYAGKKATQIVINDITEQKRAIMALEKSEKRFKALFERAGIGIVLATHDSRILETNPSFQRMVGYTADELKSMSCEDITHEEDVAIQAQFYRQIHEGKIDLYRLEKRYLHKDNYVVWGSLTMAVIRDEGGAVEYMIGMVEDISDRKRTEAELLAARDKAEEMTLLKSSFLTNMSHEIRTPLTGIMGFAAILEDDVSPVNRDLVELIKQSGKRLLRTLDAILDLSMLESGTMHFEPKRINVVDAVLTQVHLLENEAQRKGLYIKVDYNALDIFALLDSDHLERVLSNLISNAIKFTKSGGITITLQAVDNDLLIEVEDTGVGISEAFLPMLFDAFRQESIGRTRTFEGTGLGLTIVKRLVDHMGGDISVDSVPGKGSTFRVSIPGVVIEQQDRRLEDVQRERKRHKEGSRPSVLVLDDNRDARRLLRRFLEGGYYVELAGEEKDALEIARNHLFDVVLMDINLGGERTGVDALRALRHLSGYEDVPVVALTAYAVTGDRERFLSHGFDGYLGKPLTKQELYHVIADVLKS